jgi:hypothetical protein
MHRALLRRLCDSPDDFVQHIRQSTGAIIMEVGSPPPIYSNSALPLSLSSQLVYAIEVLDTDDPYIETAEKAMSYLNKAGVPGAFLVDIFPICALP